MKCGALLWKCSQISGTAFRRIWECSNHFLQQFQHFRPKSQKFNLTSTYPRKCFSSSVLTWRRVQIKWEISFISSCRLRKTCLDYIAQPPFTVKCWNSWTIVVLHCIQDLSRLLFETWAQLRLISSSTTLALLVIRLKSRFFSAVSIHCCIESSKLHLFCTVCMDKSRIVFTILNDCGSNLSFRIF